MTMLLFPITILELILYFICVKPSDGRIAKIKYRKLAKRIVTPKQNEEMWSTEEEVTTCVTEGSIKYK